MATLEEAVSALRANEASMFENQYLYMLSVEKENQDDENSYYLKALYDEAQFKKKKFVKNLPRVLQKVRKIEFEIEPMASTEGEVAILNGATSRFETNAFRSPISPIRSGCSVGLRTKESAGTISAFIKLRKDGVEKEYLFSCWHVLWGLNGAVGADCVHPASIDFNSAVIGKVVWRMLSSTLDIALVELKENVLTATQTNCNAHTLIVGSPAVNMPIKICGRTSEGQMGRIEKINHNSVRIDSDEYPEGFVIFQNQLLTNRITEKGDSGALLLNAANDEMLGVLIGANGNYSVYNQIQDVVSEIIKHNHNQKSVPEALNVEGNPLFKVFDNSDFRFEDISFEVPLFHAQ